MNESLRIAVFVGSFPVISETFILRQITGLLDLGHDVRIFANFPPDDSSTEHPEVARYDLRRRTTYVDGPPESVLWELPVRPLTGRTWPPGAAQSVPNWRRIAHALPKLARCLVRSPSLTRAVLNAHAYGYQAASLSGVYRLATLCRVRDGFDVLHAHFGPVGNSFRFARELWHAPLVVSFHGYDFSTQPRKEGAEMYRELFRTADLITVNSDYTRAQVEKLGCRPEKLRQLPVGLDPAEFPFRERTLSTGETVRLLTVARLTEIKGHEFAIRAVAKLKAAGVSVHYDVVGDGPLRQALEELARELGLGAEVVFHGACASDKIKVLYAQAHLFLLTSVSVEGDQEGQGLVLQEAQACGLPVLATRHGALPEGLLDGQSGWLVPERDVAALAERLLFLLAHASDWPMMGWTGRGFVATRYDIRNLNRQLTAIYAEAIAGHRKSK